MDRRKKGDRLKDERPFLQRTRERSGGRGVRASRNALLASGRRRARVGAPPGRSARRSSPGCPAMSDRNEHVGAMEKGIEAADGSRKSEQMS